MPAHAGLALRTVTPVALAAVLSLAACGPPPPQAPVAQANRVASALSGIAGTCGESYQQHAFGARPAGLAQLEAAAATRAGELAHVFVRNPGWIYQGETLRQVVALAVSYLRECALPGAAAALVRETATPHAAEAR
jgi:hypothetical protein